MIRLVDRRKSQWIPLVGRSVTWVEEITNAVIEFRILLLCYFSEFRLKSGFIHVRLIISSSFV
jgi:hypothetical protein